MLSLCETTFLSSYNTFYTNYFHSPIAFPGMYWILLVFKACYHAVSQAFTQLCRCSIFVGYLCALHLSLLPLVDNWVFCSCIKLWPKQLVFSITAVANFNLHTSGLSPGFQYIGWSYAIFIMRGGTLGGKFYCTKMTDYHCLTNSGILGTKPQW